MASSEGKRCIPDSEDEPMTSSPVTVSDGGASDKLCAAARVPLQDTQGAPKESPQHLLAPAKSDANVPDRRFDGLDADRVNASVDVTSASVEHSESVLHSKLVPDPAPGQQNSVPSNIASHDQPPADFEVTSTPDVEFPIPTDNTMHNAELTGQGHQSEATPEHVPPSSSTKCEPTPSPRIGQEQAASQGDLDEPVSSKHEKERSEPQQKSTSSIDDAAYGGMSHAVAKDPGSQAHHEGCDGQNDAGNVVLTQDADGRTYVPDVSTSTNDQSNFETKFDSSSTAAGMDSSSMNIASESQSIMKDDASAPSCSISIVSSTSSPSTDIRQCTGNPSADTAVRAAPSTSEPEPVSTIQFPATGSGASLDSSSGTSPHATAAAETTVVLKTPQEITLADLKAQKATMLASLAGLPAIRVLMEETATSNTDISDVGDEPTEADVMAAANKIVKDHITLLHEYNELKDVGQGLMGLIADQRGVRIVEVQEEFGIEAND
ncbi:Swi5-domain-containing protein [Ampelomyces quisqualis]|uniref:Swi5-domain-containing protein n=1 Tax=Ampelomyces quisqualis TaxID=50730 RepID=A0A6A5QKV1_AMPQU|nr:Swi5-domain-containing protein [Ampelomyces quisqualis]